MQTRPSLSTIYREVAASYEGKKQELDRVFILYRFLYRPLSFPLTAIFIRLGFSANAVSYLDAVLLSISLSIFISGNQWALATGTAIFSLFYILDFVDGNIARYNKQSSYFGKLLDGSIDTLGFLLFSAVAIATTHAGENSFSVNTEISLGVLTTILAMFNQNFQFRYSYLRHEAYLTHSIEPASEAPRTKDSFSQRRNNRALTLGNNLYNNLIVSTPVLLIISVITQSTSIFTSFFFFVHGTLGIASTIATLIVSRKTLDKPRTH